MKASSSKEDGNEFIEEILAPPEFLFDLSDFNNREKKRKMQKMKKKSVTFDMDCSGARHSDSKEWWHLRYQVAISRHQLASRHELASW